jgi:signal transduction histidine kinase
MKTLQLFLVDATDEHHKLLGKRLQNPDSIRFAVTLSGAKEAESAYRDSVGQVDIIIIGAGITPGTVVSLTKMFRSYNPAVPVFVLSRNGERKVPRLFAAVGVDGTLDAGDMGTPLFVWSFISTVEQVVLKKKAKEYDALHERLRSANSALATFVHDINNPLSVIRLALYHLETPGLPKQKRDTFFKLLLENLERIDSHMKSLALIRRQLGGKKPAKVLTLRTDSRAASR